MHSIARPSLLVDRALGRVAAAALSVARAVARLHWARLGVPHVEALAQGHDLILVVVSLPHRHPLGLDLEMVAVSVLEGGKVPGSQP